MRNAEMQNEYCRAWKGCSLRCAILQALFLQMGICCRGSTCIAIFVRIWTTLVQVLHMTPGKARHKLFWENIIEARFLLGAETETLWLKASFTLDSAVAFCLHVECSNGCLSMHSIAHLAVPILARSAFSEVCYCCLLPCCSHWMLEFRLHPGPPFQNLSQLISCSWKT